jgi:protein-S-isoprenylcysteine O-methyltransferase Ste14
MKTEQDAYKSKPNSIPWPPMILVGSLLASWFLNAALPLHVLNALLQNIIIHWLGNILFCVGLSLDSAAVITMYRARTNILPHRAANKLVDHGPFALSRNPIYLGNTILMLGLALRWANVWLLMLAAVAVIAVDRLAIRREERHLAALFGEDFKRYAARVPRWVWPLRP